jgi:hypothetical protein
MQEFSIGFSRVSRASLSANAEMKSYITDLADRAYHNLRGMPLASAEPQWAAAIGAAALQLCLDVRVQGLSPRELIQLFENVILVSEEHLHEARRHAAMAQNVFYLKETALDALGASGPLSNSAAPTVVSLKLAHGRVGAPPKEEVA